MLIPGLVSITFRQHAPEDIINLVSDANLQTIEWGGDIHVPHGDTQRAQQVAQWTRDAGLSVAAYGSYYRLATDEMPFDKVLNTTLALGAPTVRVWAGTQGYADSDEAYRHQVYDEARDIAEAAAQQNVTVSFEYHDNTLVDSALSAQDFIEKANHENIRLYWQPPHRVTDDVRMTSLVAATPYLSNVHVFFWHREHPQTKERYLLQQGASIWQPFITHLKRSESDHALMLEFVRDDDPENFKRDAATLLNWLNSSDVT